ncbi:hypothetical protein MAMC_00900 [Methylacidimicrobium cyclopophantes]|uniref:Uncharacterized protein n=1 Tax=Methylacidimicrobium cyclopophantes TaxID=1041766 RepID=A0A5E6MDS2_9BACT|nr:hypothetical protein [Methylacidimicrobium cyclopophantes]VVM05972.1 hypothetical protein MAMC_00900 [Methylacidimicrobium cyclopophantes]
MVRFSGNRRSFRIGKRRGKPKIAASIVAFWLLCLAPAWASKAYWYDIRVNHAQNRGPVVRITGPEFDDSPGLPIYLRGTPARYRILGALYIDETRLISSTWRPLERVCAAHGGKGLIRFTPAEKKAHSPVPGDLADQLWVWCYR